MIEKNEFKKWLDETVKIFGGHSACCIRMDHPELPEIIHQNNLLVKKWIKDGNHGEMEYLERMLPDKSDPWNTFPNAKAVILVAFTNKWGDPEAKHPFPDISKDSIIGYISSYAREIDYHIKGQKILNQLSQLLGSNIDAEIAVDTKPVYERLFAVFGGLGEIGANDLLRLPDRINVRVFIGALFVSADLPNVIHSPSMPFKCNDCLACIKNCPTNAITPNKPINAKRCISYLTIEKKSILSKEEGKLINDWVFGCDDCSNVCPPKEKIDSRIPIDLEWLLKSSSASIRRIIKNNAVSYSGVSQLRRNAIVILKNKNNDKSKELIEWVKINSKSKLVIDQINAW
ncbi:MAG: epoxyqueuosine reductase [Pontiellaceae bacterium]